MSLVTLSSDVIQEPADTTTAREREREREKSKPTHDSFILCTSCSWNSKIMHGLVGWRIVTDDQVSFRQILLQ